MGRIEDRTLPGPGRRRSRVRIYTPLDAETETLPGLVYFHGGGLVAGTLATHDSIGRALSHYGACRVVAVDYRLAPEHPFPAALDDAMAAVTHVGTQAARFGIDGTRLGICGDSAGGALAAATCQAAARVGRPPLALQLLICPILDYSRSTASRREFARGYLLDQATLDDDLKRYAPPGWTRPILESRRCAPRPLPVCRAPASIPRNSTRRATRAATISSGLGRAHTDVSYTCHPGMIHLFYGLGAVIPYSRTALELIGA